MSEDNQIAVAAATIKDLHRQNIELIDGGHVFMRDGVDVSETIKQASIEQIEVCDMIIRLAPQWQTLSEENRQRLEAMIGELDEIKCERAAANAAEELPEIGNYGHKET